MVMPNVQPQRCCRNVFLDLGCSFIMVDDRRLWTEDETLFLFKIFLTEPVQSLPVSSPRIQELARTLNRKPGSIHRKLADIYSNEPSYIESGRKQTNCAKLVSEIWNDLYSDCESTMKRMDVAYESVTGLDNGEIIIDYDISPGLDVPVEATRRKGQQVFRLRVAHNFEYRCCITGIAIPCLMVASHIKAWSESTPKERTDPGNGLYLNRLHDCLFDRHMMTVDEDMRIEYADSLRSGNSDDTYEVFFGRYEGMRIHEPVCNSVNNAYMDEHRAISHRLWASRT